MLDVVRNAELHALNVIALSDLLARTGRDFRAAVIRSLLREGFELEGQAPCLQHPREILEAIARLDCHEPRTTWEEFQEALQRAGRTGILLDLGPRQGPPLRHARRRNGTGLRAPRRAARARARG
ncbi:MAG TPA: hypothetical protein VN436_01550 [Holophaga sp.]|nr:hypothetical protein [Holophaga sp.]